MRARRLMRAIGGRLRFANVAAGLALFFSLAAPAWALISLHGDSVEIRHLDFPLGGGATVAKQPVAANGTFQKLATVTAKVDDGGGRVEINGAVEADNSQGNAPAAIDLRMTQAGWPIHCYVFTTTVPVGAVGTAPISLTFGRGVTPGAYKVALEARAPSGVTFADRSLSVAVLPPAKGFSFSFGSC